MLDRGVEVKMCVHTERGPDWHSGAKPSSCTGSTLNWAPAMRHTAGTSWPSSRGWDDLPARRTEWRSHRSPRVCLWWELKDSGVIKRENSFSFLGAHTSQKNGSQGHWSYIATLKATRAPRKPKIKYPGHHFRGQSRMSQYREQT